MFEHAITRTPSRDCGAGLTAADLGTPDVDRLLEQHAAYVATLRSIGLDVLVLEALEGYPDAYFVEDPAVVTPALAVLTRPGAASRRGEVDALEPVLAERLPTRRIEAPGTLDGGDVLAVEDHVFIGLSERTDHAGAEQLGRLLAEHGHTWSAVEIGAGLHLKSSVNHLFGRTLLVSEALAGHAAFDPFERVVVPQAETYACNVLALGRHLLVPSGFPRTRALIEDARPDDVVVHELDASEIRKMDGGLTCLSLRY